MYIILAILILIVLWAVFVYNGLVSKVEMDYDSFAYSGRRCPSLNDC